MSPVACGEDPALQAVNLYTIDLETGEACNLSYQVASSPKIFRQGDAVVFSADGTHLAILKRDSSDGVDVLVVATDGGSLDALSVDLHVFDVSLSPDGDKVVMVGALPGQESRQLWGMFRDGRNLRVITRESAVHSYPRWASDGHRLLYSQAPNGEETGKIGIVGFDLSRPLSFDTGMREAFGAWSPDSALIAVQITDGRIVILDSDTARPLREGTPDVESAPITPVRGFAEWAADGQSLISIGLPPESDSLWLYEFDAQDFSVEQAIDLGACAYVDGEFPGFVITDDGDVYIKMLECVFHVDLDSGTATLVEFIKQGMLDLSLR